MGSEKNIASLSQCTPTTTNSTPALLSPRVVSLRTTSIHNVQETLGLQSDQRPAIQEVQQKIPDGKFVKKFFFFNFIDDFSTKFYDFEFFWKVYELNFQTNLKPS